MIVKLINYVLFLSSLLLVLTSCSTHIESYELLEHRAMSFNTTLKPVYPSVMTGLSDMSAISGGGGCSSCAH